MRGIHPSLPTKSIFACSGGCPRSIRRVGARDKLLSGTLGAHFRQRRSWSGWLLCVARSPGGVENGTLAYHTSLESSFKEETTLRIQITYYRRTKLEMEGSIVCRGKFSRKNIWLRANGAACSTVGIASLLFLEIVYYLGTNLSNFEKFVILNLDYPFMAPLCICRTVVWTHKELIY